MQKRVVGNTGIEVSEVGWGSEWMDGQPYETVKRVVDTVLDSGISIMDMFMPGEEVRSNLGKALMGRRHSIAIQGAIGSVDLKEQYDISRDLDVCKQYFENMLRCLKTDYIDFGMLFFLDSHEAIDDLVNNGIVEYARQLKKEGKVRAIGASVHNPETALRVVRENMAEMLMFSINPAFDLMPQQNDILEMLEDSTFSQAAGMDPLRAELYRLCDSKGIGITVMKPYGAGKLLSPEHSPFSSALTPVQCIHYALTRPAVSSVLVGCRNEEEVKAAVRYSSATDEERDYTSVIGSFKGDGKDGFRGSCVYCNHCLPCPATIDIGQLNKFLDIARLDETRIPHSVKRHYDELKAHGSDCIECGKCETRCPFSVPVIANMKKAASLFGR